MIKSLQDLKVWQKAYNLVCEVYRVTQKFPKEELFGITTQIRRAVVSVSANIVEGTKRKTTADFCHFLFMAQSSLEETKYYFILTHDLGFLSDNDYSRLWQNSEEIGLMLNGLIKSLRKRKINKSLIASIFLLYQFIALSLYHSYAAFEEREKSARVLGMSGVSVGVADEIDSVFYNPAGLVNFGEFKLQGSDSNLYNILNYRTFCFAIPLPLAKRLGTFGLAYEEFGFKEQYKETEFYFSQGIPIIDNFSVGYSIKSLGLKILYDEKTKRYTKKTLTSFDLAGFSSFSEKISAGIAFYNVNNPQIVEDESVSISYKLGVGYKLSEHFNFGLDFEKGNIWRIGAEIRPNNVFVFRSGIKFIPLKFSFGIGLNLWKLSFDYGISYHSQLEFHHLVTFSFAYKFKEYEEKPKKEKKISFPVETEEIQPAEVEEEPINVPMEKKIEERIEKPVEEPKISPPVEILPVKTPESPVETQSVAPLPQTPVIPEKPQVEIPIEPKININKANEQELKMLGLSESVVKNIIRYRKYKGEFKSIDELRKVPGVTEKIFGAIKDRITVE